MGKRRRATRRKGTVCVGGPQESIGKPLACVFFGLWLMEHFFCRVLSLNTGKPLAPLPERRRVLRG
jgi:hypothetical protein